MTQCYVLEPIHDDSGSRIEPGEVVDLEPAVFLRLSKAKAVESMKERAARLDGARKAVAVKKEAEAEAKKEAEAIEADAAEKAEAERLAAEAAAKAAAEKRRGRRGR